MIVPLSENRSVPVATREDDGSRGVFGLAEALMTQGWGVPIIHDTTDCLRIGDITFVSTTGSGRPKFTHRTVEVKTHRLSAVTNGDGTETVNYRATIVGHDPLPEGSETPLASGVVDSAPPEARRLREDRRLQKQLRRMNIAIHKRRAEDNSISILDGQAYVSVTADVKRTDWKEVRRVIRRARDEGFAAFGDSQLVTWLMFYNAAGVDNEDIPKAGMLAAAQRMLDLAPEGKRNSVTIFDVPPSSEDESAPRSLPFWLWDVPKRAKREILRRQLLIIAIVNSAGLEGALEERGFRIEHGSRRDPRSFEIIREIRWPDGTRGESHHPAPWPEITDAVQDFTGLHAVLAKLDAMTSLGKLPYEDLMTANPARMN